MTYTQAYNALTGQFNLVSTGGGGSGGIPVLGTTTAATTVTLNATYNNGTAGAGATLTNAGALAALVIDGVTPTLGQRILVKDQSTTFQNGVYSLTTAGSGSVAWVLTRTTDYDTPLEIRPGTIIPVQLGTMNSNTLWIQNDTVVNIGTDPIQFTQFSSAAFATTQYAVLVGAASNGVGNIGPGAANTVFVGTGVTSNPAFTTTPTVSSITILNAPVSGTDATNKTYVDAIASGIVFLSGVYAATTANLNATYNNGASGVGATLTNAGAQAAFSIDGTTPVLNARILVKNQTTQADNGVYSLTTVGDGSTNWVLTRTTDYDHVAQIFPGNVVPVASGTVNALTNWIQVDTMTTIGASAIQFNQFSSGPIFTTQFATLVGGATNSIVSIGPSATAGQIYQSGGSSANPAFSTNTYPSTNALGDIFYGSATNVISPLTASATATQYLSNTGVGNIPAWGYVNLTNGVTGILPSANGGLGGITGVVTANGASAPTANTITEFSILVGGASNAVTNTAVGATGTVVIGNTGAAPTFSANPSVSSISATTVTISGTPSSNSDGTNVLYVTNALAGLVTNVVQFATLVGGAANVIESIGPSATAGQIYQSGGSSANPAFSTNTYPATNAQGDLLYGSSANVIGALTKSATATQYLTNTGTANNPAWGYVNLANGVTGLLPSANGGLGGITGIVTANGASAPTAATVTQHGILVAAASNAVGNIALGVSGTVLVGSTGNDPTFSATPTVTSISATTVTITGTPSAGSDGTNVTYVTNAISTAVGAFTLTGDTGGPLSPTTSNWNLIGQKAGTFQVMEVLGSGSTETFENRVWATPLVVDPSSTIGLRGTFTTISLALAAASSGQTIFVRPGTYTEDITLVSGVNLQAFQASGKSGATTISGNITASFGGNPVTIDGFTLQNNGNNDVVTISGTNGTQITFNNCYFNQTSTSGPNYYVNCSNGSAYTKLINCTGTLSGAGAACFNVSNSGGGIGGFVINNCNFYNDQVSSQASMFSTGGNTVFNNVVMQSIIDQSAGVLFLNSCNIGRNDTIFTPLTLTGTAHCLASFTEFQCDEAVVISIASGCTAELNQCLLNVDSPPGGVLISNLGTLAYDIITQRDYGAGSGQGTVPAPSQSQLMYQGTTSFTQGQIVAVKAPGSYPYTTLQSDYIILVDSSSARTITPMASPLKGQIYVIKDNTGTASTHNITVTPSGKNIDGAASAVIATPYGSLTIVYNGTQWNII